MIRACLAGLLGLLAAAGWAQDWREVQSQYRDLAPERHPTVRVDTLANEALGVSDRCTACHAAVEDGAMRDALPPLRTHPGRYLQWHPAREYGCTLCHGGDGARVDADAHGRGTARALLEGDLIQTRCTLCHRDRPLPGALALSRGQALIEELGCTGCHVLEGFQTKGPPCPPLAGLGSKVGFTWLKRWLMRPQEFSPGTTMPDAHLTEEQAAALSAYLLSSRDEGLDAAPEPPAGDPEAGGNLVRSVRCISCHAFNGRGGGLAPDLGRIGNKVNRRWLLYMLRDTHRYLPDSAMPQFGLSDPQASDAVAYLTEEFTDYDLQEAYEEDPGAAPRDASTLDVGRRIFKEMRCANCHTRSLGDEPWLQLGPVLTGIGAKGPEAFDFGDSPIPQTTSDYLFEKVRNPRAFAASADLLKMPDFHLDDADAKDIVVALLASRGTGVAAKQYEVPPNLPSVFAPAGEAGRLFDRYRCLSCHAVRGRGFNLAYDLTIEGSRVRPDWLYRYLLVPYSIRPILVERMPVFQLAPDEARTLADYIARELTTDQIPADLGGELTAAMAARGEQLFDEKGCAACHQVGDRGGYVGPSFTTGTAVGQKLRAGWIYRWLKDPQALVPDAIEPDYGLSDGEAKALTAYLMQLSAEASP